MIVLAEGLSGANSTLWRGVRRAGVAPASPRRYACGAYRKRRGGAVNITLPASTELCPASLEFARGRSMLSTLLIKRGEKFHQALDREWVEAVVFFRADTDGLRQAPQSADPAFFQSICIRPNLCIGPALCYRAILD